MRLNERRLIYLMVFFFCIIKGLCIWEDVGLGNKVGVYFSGFEYLVKGCIFMERERRFLLMGKI